jgi:hypothetical protein
LTEETPVNDGGRAMQVRAFAPSKSNPLGVKISSQLFGGALQTKRKQQRRKKNASQARSSQPKGVKLNKSAVTNRMDFCDRFVKE